MQELQYLVIKSYNLIFFRIHTMVLLQSVIFYISTNSFHVPQRMGIGLSAETTG